MTNISKEWEQVDSNLNRQVIDEKTIEYHIACSEKDVKHQEKKTSESYEKSNFTCNQ